MRNPGCMITCGPYVGSLTFGSLNRCCRFCSTHTFPSFLSTYDLMDNQTGALKFLQSDDRSGRFGGVTAKTRLSLSVRRALGGSLSASGSHRDAESPGIPEFRSQRIARIQFSLLSRWKSSFRGNTSPETSWRVYGSRELNTWVPANMILSTRTAIAPICVDEKKCRLSNIKANLLVRATSRFRKV